MVVLPVMAAINFNQNTLDGEGKEWTWFLHGLWLHMQKLPQQKYLTMSTH